MCKWMTLDEMSLYGSDVFFFSLLSVLGIRERNGTDRKVLRPEHRDAKVMIHGLKKEE